MSRPQSKPLKQIHLAAHFPGVNNTTVWSDPRAGQPHRVQLVRAASRRRPSGRSSTSCSWPKGCGCASRTARSTTSTWSAGPDTFTVLAALAAVTDRLGLAGTINSTFNEPYEVARQFASLDHLSAGRAAWNVVTSWDAFTGENFRRGGFLPQDERYERAEQFLRTAWELFDSWRGDEIVADKESGVFLADPRRRRVRPPRRALRHRRPVQRAAQPAGPAGDLPGRRLRRGTRVRRRHRRRDLQPARHARGGPGVLRRRQGPAGTVRPHAATQLLILPAATFVLGDTDAEAAEHAHVVRRQQVSGQTAIKFLEQLWNRDLSGYDPDGPLPDVDPAGGREHHRPGAGERADVPRPAGDGTASGGSSPRPRSSPSAS